MIKYPLIIFDGVCVLCNRVVGFLLRFDKKKQFRYVTLQSEAGNLLKQKFKIPVETDSVLLIFKNRVYTESEAVIKIASLMPFPWNSGVVLNLFPKKFNNYLYKWVAENRYRWFGKKTSCRVPTPEEKFLFPDVNDLEI